MNLDNGWALVQRLNVELNDDEKLEEVDALKLKLNEAEEELDELKSTLVTLRDELDGYIKHFSGIFYTDGKNYPLEDFYTDMSGLGQDIVKTLKLLKEQAGEN